MHEQQCDFRPFDCPSQFSNNCEWHGPLRHFLRHAVINKCALFLKTQNMDHGWTTVINAHTSPFGDNQYRHIWPPMFLTCPQIGLFRNLCALYVLRDPTGQWRVFVKSFAHEMLRRKLLVKIEIFGVKDHKYNHDDCRVAKRFIKAAPLDSWLSYPAIMTSHNVVKFQDQEVINDYMIQQSNILYDLFKIRVHLYLNPAV
jgi:hypothetical protein